MTTPLSLSPDLEAYFRQEFQYACKALSLRPSAQTEAYLISLLDDFTRPGHDTTRALGFERPAALMLGEAQQKPPGQRLEAYRQLGDVCLYNCGFFEEHLTRRSLSTSYFIRIGRTAYEQVSSLCRQFKDHVFGGIFLEIGQLFAPLVDAFQRVKHGSFHSAQGVLWRLQRGEQVSTEELERAGLLVRAT